MAVVYRRPSSVDTFHAHRQLRQNAQPLAVTETLRIVERAFLVTRHLEYDTPNAVVVVVCPKSVCFG